MRSRLCSFAIACGLFTSCAGAATLSRSTITDVVKDVTVMSATGKAQKAARVNDPFVTPEILRTGAESRAEMIAPDQTVTRVGANTLFSFERQSREANLERGSVLFHSPAGKGGGTIKTAAATASVLGTTLIVVATSNGGFKVLVLEGRGRVATARGEARILNAGQLVFVLPGQRLGPVLTFQLRKQATASRLVHGFKRPLPSLPKIAVAMQIQEKRIAKGQIAETDLLVGDSPEVAYRIDPNATERFVQREKERAVEEAVTETANQELAGGEGVPLPAGAGGVASATSPVFCADVRIVSPFLDPACLLPFSDPSTPRPLTTTGNGAGGSLFVSQGNMTFATSSVDLGAFNNGTLFEFLATGNLLFEQSVQIAGLVTTPLSLVAGGTVRAAPGTSVIVNNPQTDLYAFGSSYDLAAPPPSGPGAFSDASPLQLANFNFRNFGGNISVFAPSISLRNAGFAAAGDLLIQSAGAVDIQDNRGPSRLGAGGRLGVRAATNLRVARSGVIAERIGLFARDNLVVQGARFSNKDADPTRGAVALRAGNLIDLTGARFQLQNVAMQAPTINLRQVSFANQSRVVLDSAVGKLAPRPNTNQPPRPGFVNFISGVRYGPAPAQQAVGTGITIK